MARRNNSRKKKGETVSFWNTIFFKLSSKILLGVLIILVILTLSQCTIKKPASPSWNTNFAIPVVNHTYSMAELLEKINQPEISMDSDGVISISVTEDIQPAGIDASEFAIPNVSRYISQSLGMVSLDPPAVAPVSLSLNLISGLASSLPGDSAIIPPDSFSVFNELADVGSYSQVTVSSGTITATIDNNLGVDISWARIAIYDRAAYTIVATDTINTTIATGTSASIPILLDGATLSNKLRMDVVCGTPGGLISNYSTRYISTSIDFSNPVLVIAGVAEIPALADKVYAQKTALTLDAGEQIDSASFATGNLNISLTNNSNLDASIDIYIPSLESNGVPYSEVRQIAANSTININQNLSGYDLIPSSDSLDIRITTYVPGSGGVMTSFDQSNNFIIDANFTNFTFNSVSGVFNNNVTGVSENISDLSVPDGFDDIGFVNASLLLEVENGIDLPGDLDITITADNGKTLNLTGTIDARGNEFRKLSMITANDIGDFLTPLPGSINIGGTITFGDSQSHTINHGDSVFARVKIFAPMYVKINNAEVSDIDIEKSDLNQDDMDAITNHFIEGRFVYEVTNRLPLGVTAIIHMSGDSASLFGLADLTLDTIQIDAAPVSPLTGITTDEVVSSGEILLDSLDIQVLNNDSLFVRQEIFLNGSDTAGVQLIGSDYITITGRIEIEYLFDGEF